MHDFIGFIWKLESSKCRTYYIVSYLHPTLMNGEILKFQMLYGDICNHSAEVAICLNSSSTPVTIYMYMACHSLAQGKDKEEETTHDF